MRNSRQSFNDSVNDNVKMAFKAKFNYNSETGEITNIRTGRQYLRLNKKGYRESIYLIVDHIEYRVLYHRLCWFLYYNEVIPNKMQIDHIDNVKTNNTISNLRIVLNEENIKKKAIYKSNTTGLKGVSISRDISHGKVFNYFTSTVSIQSKCFKIGRFKKKEDAAMCYDSAVRYYNGDNSLCNYKEQLLEPMSIEMLRVYKKQNKL